MSRPVYTPGAVLIAIERTRQRAGERFSADHDSQHTHGELVRAGAAYALSAAGSDCASGAWPWRLGEFKPADKVRDLVRAGALIAAELDRMGRSGGAVSATFRYEPPGDWRAEAACRGMDSDLFYAEREAGRDSVAAVKDAKAVCNACPSVQPCLVYALSANEKMGVWGGLSPLERRLVAKVFGRMKVCAICSIPFMVRSSQGMDIYCGEECRAEARRRTVRASHERRSA